ncbi:MAG: family 78 glycoside hydrolase catalytic domain [Lachnospiraceae bacterium]|nr:family 78 glycoside hydrolase catalytic domain [Lachnospiraceae bacterium]
MRITDCQLNHLEKPIGYRLPRLSFSWKVRESSGKSQSSARIRIAEDPGMETILADTGWDSALDSLGSVIELSLRSRTRLFWTVAVRSDAGEEAESEVNYFETGKMDEPWSAHWISCESSERRHPLFEKAIELKGKVKSARLYVCGLGLYEIYYRDERIGDEFFTPYSNNYNRWVQVQTFDMTDALHREGTLSILLGNGWYKGRFGFSALEEKGFYGQEWKLIAELRISYSDGSEEVIGTDDSWTVHRSNITFSNIYDGEHRDDTLPELPLEQARFCDMPMGRLTDRMSTPVTVHEILQPIELIITPRGETVLDMGQEITGIFSLKVNAPKGQTVHLQTCEILQQGNFYNANLRTAKSEYIYVSDGREITLIPHFTFYGFRYVKIEGLPKIRKEDFTALVLYSHIPERSTMRTGHKLVNKLLSNVRWGLKDNFLDVPTDCPQRDERMGWTGDTQVFSPTAMYLQDCYSFYAKYLYDCWQEQQELGGKVPDVIPSFGVYSTACVWGDMACILPWNIYTFYGDKAILEDQFESMKAWVDYVRAVDGDDHHWREVFHYGDWLALDNIDNDPEAIMGATDVGFLANLYYAVSAEIVANAAAVLGLEEEEKGYRTLSAEQFGYVRDEYYSKTGRCCVKTQTALLLTLKYGLSDNTELTKKQLHQLFRDSDFKLKTGFVGTPLICNILSENGMEDIAWKLLLNEDYPGWLHEIKLGATTVWERWNGLLDDGTISGTSMNSMNHYAYGSIIEWLYRHVAGLNISEKHPGCRHLDIAPSLNWALREQETVYDSPAGEYRSAWRLIDSRHVEISITVPFGCTATLALPHAKDATDLIYLCPGTHKFSYESDTTLKPAYSTYSNIRELRSVPEIREKLPMLGTVPKQYIDKSLRELADLFGGRMTPEQLDGIDSMLKAM